MVTPFLRSRFHCETLIHLAVSNDIGVAYHHVGYDAIDTEQGATPTEPARISRKVGAYLWLRATTLSPPLKEEPIY